MKKNLYIERREEGYAILRPNVAKPLEVKPTQKEAIERAQQIGPNAALHVERVRHTEHGTPDKWRKL